MIDLKDQIRALIKKAQQQKLKEKRPIFRSTFILTMLESTFHHIVVETSDSRSTLKVQLVSSQSGIEKSFPS